MNDKSKKTGKGAQTGKPAVSQRATDQNRTPNKSSSTSGGKTPAASAASRQSSTGGTTQAASSSSRSSTTQRATASTSGSGGNNNQHTVREEKSSGGWLAPVALLFGLVGTLLSGFLWSKLNSFSTSTTTALTSQKEETQSLVADTKTELTAALDEKSATLTTAMEEQSATLNTAMEEQSASLTTAMDEQSTSTGENIANLDKNMGEQLNSSKEEIALSTAETLQDFSNKSEEEMNVMSTSFNVGIRTLREDMETRFQSNGEKVAMMEETLQTTNELANRGQRDWILAEVEYLLRTGHHRVKLAGDVKAGILALESANDRLHALGDIDYFPVREQIKKEVTELRRLGPPNIEGLIFRLETASKVADTLPLKPSEDADSGSSDAEGDSDEGSSGVGGLLKSMKFSVSSTNQSAIDAKKSRNSGGSNTPNKEQISASEALSTHLQAARLSALRADSERFVYHMDNSLNYTGDVFDGEQESVQTFVTDLENIRETNIVPNVPILGSALSMFEKIDAKRSEK